MLEKTIEAAFVKRVKELGGIAEKFVSPNKRSVPDRIVMFPGGKLLFVELKAPARSRPKCSSVTMRSAALWVSPF